MASLRSGLLVTPLQLCRLCTLYHRSSLTLLAVSTYVAKQTNFCMSEPFVFQSPFHFRYGQTWSETKTSDFPGESLTRSHFLLPRKVLFACPPPSTSWNPPSLWSPPFPLHIPALIPLSPKCGKRTSRSPSLSPISWSGDLD